MTDSGAERAARRIGQYASTCAEYFESDEFLAKVAAIIREETGTQVERERDAAIGILARLHWCECGHQHFGAEICMGCDCDEQIPVSREWLVEKIKAQAAAPDEGGKR